MITSPTVDVYIMHQQWGLFCIHHIYEIKVHRNKPPYHQKFREIFKVFKKVSKIETLDRVYIIEAQKHKYNSIWEDCVYEQRNLDCASVQKTCQNCIT